MSRATTKHVESHQQKVGWGGKRGKGPLGGMPKVTRHLMYARRPLEAVSSCHELQCGPASGMRSRHSGLAGKSRKSRSHHIRNTRNSRCHDEVRLAGSRAASGPRLRACQAHVDRLSVVFSDRAPKLPTRLLQQSIAVCSRRGLNARETASHRAGAPRSPVTVHAWPPCKQCRTGHSAY